ncbi:MAG: hypothetical protein U0441_22625 [Polyangiaceae bacterium]
MNEKRLAAALESAVSLAANLREEPRVADLRRTLNALEDERPARATPTPALAQRALQGAALLVTDGLADRELLAAVTGIYNGAFTGGRRLHGKAALLPAPLPLMVLSAPRARAIARDLFVPEGDRAEEAKTLSPDRAPESDAGTSVAAEPKDAVIPAVPGPLRVEDGGEPVPRRQFLSGVTEHCLDTLASRSRQRVELPFAGIAEPERSLLAACDALAAVSANVVEQTLAWWSAKETPSRWTSWALAAALSSFEGADALLALEAGLSHLPETAVEHAGAAAEALAIFANPDVDALARDLLEHPSPVLRAVGLETLSLRGGLAIEEIRRLLWDVNVPVLAAAVRAVGRLPTSDAALFVPLLIRWLRFPDADVAWTAARELALLHRAEPMIALRDGKLAHLRPEHALELFVLAGDTSDLEAIQRVLARAPVGEAELDALARFGHVGALSFLLHHLSEGDLVDEAVDALLTLFGPLVPPEEAGEPAPWKQAIKRARLDTSVRYRRGEPWSPAVIAREIEPRKLSIAGVDRRAAELGSRCDLPSRPKLSGWSTDIDAEVRALLREAQSLSPQAGQWTRAFG